MNKRSSTSIQMIADYEGDVTNLFNVNIDGELPILATRNIAIFPGVISPVIIGRKQSLNLLDKLRKHNDAAFAVFCQKDQEVENPEGKDLFEYGVYAKLVKVLEMPGPGNNLTAIIQGLGRCRLKSITRTMPFMLGEVCPAMEDVPKENDKEFATAMEDMRSTTLNYIRMNEDLPDESQFALNNISNNVIAVDFVCTNLPFSIEDKELLISTGSIKERVIQTLRVLHKEMQLLELKQNIRSKTREDLDEQQREYFLQQQIKNIKEELGGGEGSPERKDLEENAKSKAWPEEVDKIFRKELDKLDMFNPQSPEYSIQYNYLQTMTNLPWGEYTKDNLDLKRAQRILNHDHYGMEKVKERILEYMAVLKLRGDLKSPIICLYGPPGVGKTSLGKSIAAAMKRKYVRMSLGGLHDESEIRGHRRTYVGAMPGRIIKNIQKAGSANPVFILDEIDKVTQNTINGDPSSALLEVLDPEQNNAFHDNYLDVDFDLSKVLFIATANDLGSIPRPLLDRMELIEVSGYITEEKIEIAKRHLIPREIDNCGLTAKEDKPTFTKAAIEKIIEQYTRESGVRQLEKQVNKALRKLAYKKALNDVLPYEKITPNEIEDLLGKPPFYRDIYQGNDYAGVVTGLAWTSVGGEILFIETSLSKGKAGKLTLTGNLGDVMKESAVIALEYVKAHIDSLGVDYRIFNNWNIHIHVPEGATPKDGPSAGITIATSIASALTQRKVRKNTAMTGEITLRGKVLPVGGIKEKILAAKRAGITDIVMCQDNRKDIEEIPEIYRKGVEFHYVENVQDVWKFALTDEKVDNPIDLSIKEEEKN
ncbi:endopeptidase La [uncultured Prevotella sp.]|uniref:endopeptidase La n=1 Tax=uncultured Prevotella sp. TaxID=159272 RepID=UPI0026DD4339|nr:endopeptidase La [uncultured Prevotella sp.]